LDDVLSVRFNGQSTGKLLVFDFVAVELKQELILAGVEVSRLRDEGEVGGEELVSAADYGFYLLLDLGFKTHCFIFVLYYSK